MTVISRTALAIALASGLAACGGVSDNQAEDLAAENSMGAGNTAATGPNAGGEGRLNEARLGDEPMPQPEEGPEAKSAERTKTNPAPAQPKTTRKAASKAEPAPAPPPAQPKAAPKAPAAPCTAEHRALGHC
jgi:outer membrane biosynthesis protein TonB